MNLPKIDLASLPGLDTLTALFGTLTASGDPGSDDTTLILMTYLYETMPPEMLL